MSIATHELTVTALRTPQRLVDLDAAQWDLLVRQARQADLLARLYGRLDACGVLSCAPEPARLHFEAAHRVAQKHVQAVRWEIDRIAAALAGSGVPLVLLKGAAYLAAGLPPANGRVFADIDVMVPRAALGEVEKRLLMHGWAAEKLHPYDQRYYRRWMHELPPMRHRRRDTLIDVHHSILPLTSRYPLDARLLYLASVALDEPGLRVLSPVDMVLHSATHLFCDGEFDHALRDLADLDDLLRHFGAEEAFWPRLAARALALGLVRPLYYAVEQGRRLLAMEVPDVLGDVLGTALPGPLTRGLMHGLLERAMPPEHASCVRPFSGAARGLLYVRGHYLRMPLHLLLPHLLRKSWRKEEQEL